MARREDAADATAVTEADIDNMTDEELEAALAAEADEPAPEPAPEPEPEAKPEDEEQANAADEGGDADDVGENDGEKSETVPHGQFHRERERRKAAEVERDRALQRMDAMLKVVGGRQQAEQPQEEQQPPPSLHEQPVEFIQGLADRVNQIDQREQYKQAVTQYVGASEMDMQQYAQENPDAVNAYKYLESAYKHQLAEAGITDPAAQAQRIAHEQAQVTYWALQRGIRPAHQFEMLARSYGYQPTPVEPQPDPKKVAEEIDQKEATKAAARSMKDTGAPVDTGLPSAEAVTHMTDAEFDVLLKKFNGDFDALEAAIVGLDQV